jgi:16S rRNA (adenine1518-N6/adenine1519-N6)-dimethyltransferase
VRRTSTGSSSRRNPDRGPGAAVLGQLAELGLRPSRGLGQSFLIDPFVADAEAALVETKPGEPVLEIGGGLGHLTEALLRRGIGPLTVLERDRRLARYLEQRFAGQALVITGDATSIELPPAAAVVGNLPFSVATPILVRLLEARVPRIVVLLQREVVARIVASPGGRAYGRLTVFVRLFAEPVAFRIVPAASFAPVPEVDGQLLVLTARPGPPPVPSVPHFERLMATLFSVRRKQLGNVLPRALPPGADPGEIARAADWPAGWATARPEELPPEAFYRLATVLGAPARQA